MPKALVVYATRTGETKAMAEFIAEGMRFVGVEAEVRDAKEIKDSASLAHLDALVIGSPTYHGDMVQSVKTFLFLCEKADLSEKIGGAFGAFGWSGEAPDRIYDTMKHIFGMQMAAGPLRLMSVSVSGGMKVAQDYGREIAKLLMG
jgi:flavorubredoxin